MAGFERAARMLLAGEVAGHQVYSLPAHERKTLRQIVETFFDLAGVTPTLHWGARAYRPREMLVPWTGGVPLPGWLFLSLAGALGDVECSVRAGHQRKPPAIRAGHRAATGLRPALGMRAGFPPRGSSSFLSDPSS